MRRFEVGNLLAPCTFHVDMTHLLQFPPYKYRGHPNLSVTGGALLERRRAPIPLNQCRGTVEVPSHPANRAIA